MASFLSLPNEIKLQIIETIAPDDIENFALCCKLVHSLAGKTLMQHKADRKTHFYLNFSVVGAREEGDILQPYYQVLDMAANSRLRLYRRKLQIFNGSCSDSERQRTLMQSGLLNEMAQICGKIFDGFVSPYIHEKEMMSWCKKVSDGGIQDVTRLLLTLLPNVRAMILSYPVLWGSASADIVNKISRANLEAPPSMNNSLSLTKLSSVVIGYSASMALPTSNNGLVEAFMGLPSVRIIFASYLGPEEKFDRWFHPCYQSNLNEIHICYSTLGVQSIARLLSHPRSLQKFSYDHRKRYEIEGEDYSPDALINVLFQRARKTLTYLEYTTDAEDSVGNNRTRSIGTLRRFESLRSLRLSRVLFLENGRMQRLVDELPVSTVELQLDFKWHISQEEAKSIFDGMLESKQERLPNLKLILIYCSVPFDEEAVSVCERVGITLDWIKPGVSRGQKTGRKVEC